MTKSSALDGRIRLIALALEPALVLARIAALPLDDLQSLVATGYFRETRARGLSYPMIARRFDKSVRSVATLAKEAASKQVLPRATNATTRRRKILETISRRNQVTRKALGQAFSQLSPKELDDELVQLTENGLLVEKGGMFRLAKSHFDFTHGELEQRLDAVRHLFSGVAQVIFQRFFTPTGSTAEAFVRTFTFKADRASLSTFRQRSYERMKDEILDVDRSAPRNDAANASAILCVVEEPKDPAWSPRSS